MLGRFWTKDYKHVMTFKFNNKHYLVHSVVRLTDEGKKYLGSRTKEVVLTEVFYNWNNILCWKYQFRGLSLTSGVIELCTDRPPDELIEEVVIPATPNYTEREVFGTNASSYTTGNKKKPKDWEIPEVLTGWIIYIIIFFTVAVFKDWYVKLIIRIAAGWFFGIYRQSYVDAYTTYEHPEDEDMLKKKYEILYGIQNKTKGE